MRSTFAAAVMLAASVLGCRESDDGGSMPRRGMPCE